MASKQFSYIGKYEPRWVLEDPALPGGNGQNGMNMPE